MNNRHIILIVFALALLSGCSNFDPQAYVPGLETPTSTSTLEAPTLVSVTAALPIIATTDHGNKSAIVCTNIPDGKLNVRFEAGDKSDVRGYLAEDEIVTVSEDHQELDGNLWVKLSRPIDGWVNSKYLCEAVSP
jgi:hypothetical protein